MALLGLLFWMSFVMIKSSWLYNYQIVTGSRNPLAYVHTHPNMPIVARQIEEFFKKKVELENGLRAKRIYLGIDGYWPFPYYLRNIKAPIDYETDAAMLNDCELLDRTYGVLILDKLSDLKCDGWKGQYYRLADHVESKVWFPKD